MSNIQKIAVLGSGVMGHGIAQISATAGYTVALRDIEDAFLQKAMDKIKWSLGKLIEKKN
jgi:enoyl-CoA hydratase/3-hydroxyacyl-CoA dehydrogenase